MWLIRFNDFIFRTIHHWLALSLSGSLWLAVRLSLSGSLWLSLAHSGSLWLAVRLTLALSGSLWLAVRLTLALSGSLAPSGSLSSSLWLSLALSGLLSCSLWLPLARSCSLSLRLRLPIALQICVQHLRSAHKALAQLAAALLRCNTFWCSGDPDVFQLSTGIRGGGEELHFLMQNFDVQWSWAH